jgi:hypothetical protein
MSTIAELNNFNRAAVEYLRGVTSGLLTPFVIPLDTANEAYPISLMGNFIYIGEATDANSFVNIQFNKRNDSEAKIKLVKSLGFIHPFEKVFLSWTAQPGKSVTVLVGQFGKQMMDIIDNRSAVDQLAVLEQIRDELKGTGAQNWGIEAVGNLVAVEILAANPNRKSALIAAHPLNTGIVALGWDDTVDAASKYFYLLEAGDSYAVDDCPDSVFAIANAAGQVVSFSEV